jgi:hypothetical protein
VTIVVGVATPDGIVMAADSRTTYFLTEGESQSHYRIASDTAEKLFTVRGRFGVATYGDAFIGPQTIAGVMDEFIAGLEDQPPMDIDAFAAALGDFFDARWLERSNMKLEEVPEGHFRVGFLVAGYGADGIGRLQEVRIPTRDAPLPDPIDTTELGFMYRGEQNVIDRLLAGVDWPTFAATLPEDVKPPEEIVETLNGLEYELLFPITLQDGIDLASFLIRTTIDMQRFTRRIRSGPTTFPTCGGDTQVLAVRRSDVEWVTFGALQADRPAGQAEGRIDD